jgi:hypothetical protein
MAWTTPKTWAVGDVLTAADMNTYVRDDLEALAPAGTLYASMTPVFSSANANASIGNGFTNGRYLQIGKRVHYYGRMVAGSSTAFGSGTLRISLPVNSGQVIGGSDALGSAWLFDTSASAYAAPGVQIDGANAGYFILRYPAAWPQGALTDADATHPWTWASGDSMHWSVVYEGV